MLPRSSEFISCLSKIQVPCFLESASVFLKKDSVISKRKAKAVFTWKISDKERHPIPIFLFSSAKDRLGIEIWATLYGPVWLLPARQLAGQAASSSPRPPKSNAWDCCLSQAAFPGSEANKPYLWSIIKKTVKHSTGS